MTATVVVGLKRGGTPFPLRVSVLLLSNISDLSLLRSLTESSKIQDTVKKKFIPDLDCSRRSLVDSVLAY